MTRATASTLLLCVACASRGHIAQIGPDTFRASRVAQSNHTTFDHLERQAKTDAAAFCRKQGKVVEVVIERASGPAYGVAKGYTGSDLEFRCVIDQAGG